MNAAHDCAEGGLSVALAEMAIASQLGAEINLPDSDQRLDNLLFGESASRIVVAVAPEHQPAWENYLAGQSLPWQKLGVVGTAQGNLTFIDAQNNALIDLPVSALTEPWQTAIARRLKS